MSGKNSGYSGLEKMHTGNVPEYLGKGPDTPAWLTAETHVHLDGENFREEKHRWTRENLKSLIHIQVDNNNSIKTILGCNSSITPIRILKIYIQGLHI